MECLDQDEIFKIINEKQRFFYIGDEKKFESFIVENIKEIVLGLGLSPIKIIESQKLINIGDFHIKPDIILSHEDDSITIVEVKKTNNKHPATGTSNQIRGIGQCLLYKSIIAEMTNRYVRVILIDEKIYSRTLMVFSDNDLPISLIEVQDNRVFCPRLRL